MMKHRIIRLVAPAMLVVCLMLASLPVSAAERARIEAFLNTTGFDVALESIALTSSSAPDMLGIDPGAFGSEWKRLTSEVFDTGLMHDMALDILEDTLSDEALDHAVAFYAGDLGQRLVEAENTSHMIEEDQIKQAQGQTIVAQLIEDSPERIETFERMSKAIDASGTAMRALQEVQYRFLLAANAAGIVELRLDPEDLRALLSQNEDELRESLRQSALAGNAFTYRDFSDAEVLEYTEALEDPLMQQVYELLNAVQYEIMANRFEILASRMAGLQPSQDL